MEGEEPGLVTAVFGITLMTTLAPGAISVVALVLRFRRAPAVQRQQIKWFAYLAAPSVPLGMFAQVPPYGPYLEFLGAALQLAGLGIGILWFRLWDIDRLINRTLVYGLLTAILGLCYAAGSLLFVLVAGAGSDPPSWLVAAAILAAAAVFLAIRGRIQAVVDRRFNRRRYQAAKIVEAFSTRLRDRVDLDSLSAELVAVADHTMEPTMLSLWLRPPMERSERLHSPTASGRDA